MEVETITHIIIYLFSFLGLAWIPAGLNRFKWIFPVWFLIINCYLFSSIWKYNLDGKPWLLILGTQAGWVLVSAWFISKSRRNLIHLDFSEWIKWQTFRLMNCHFLFLIYAYTLPVKFILEVSILEIIISLSAWPVSRVIKKNGVLPKLLFIGWNILGFISLWRINIHISSLLIKSPHDSYSLDVARYFNLFPEIWIPAFWIPVGITAHLVMLSSLLGRPRRSQ